MLSGARVRRDPVQVFVGEHPLRQRREHDAADAELAEHVEKPVLDPPVEQRIRRLMDEERRAEPAQDRRRLLRLRRRVRRDAGVERLALAYGGVERAHRLLERRLRIEAVRVEDVDVVETHPPEALIEAREQVLAGAVVAVGAGPHVVAGFRRDHELVAVRTEILFHEPAEVLLGRPVRRPVVVREVEVRDAEIERAADDRAARVERAAVTEVLPEPERDRGQLEPARAAAPVGHPGIAFCGRDEGHRDSLREWQLDAEARALARLGHCAHRSAVRLRDSGDDRQPEPHAAARARTRRVGAVEALEDVRHLIRAHSGTGVGDDDRCTPVRPAQRDVRRCARRRMGANVRQQVVDDLAQPVAIAEHHGGFELDLDRPLRLDQVRGLDGLRHDVGELDRVALERAPFIETREQQQIVDEQAHPLGLARDARHRAGEVGGPVGCAARAPCRGPTQGRR